MWLGDNYYKKPKPTKPKRFNRKPKGTLKSELPHEVLLLFNCVGTNKKGDIFYYQSVWEIDYENVTFYSAIQENPNGRHIVLFSGRKERPYIDRPAF